MRLDSYLVHTGMGSKKEMKQAVKRKRVKVNGQLELLPEKHIDPQKDRVAFDGKVIIYQEHYYYMYHKPSGVICASKDKKEKTVIDSLPEVLINQGVFSVGRLDKDTTGLLFLTTDGKWNHKVRHPKSEKEKCYYLQYEGNLKKHASALVKEGLDLGDFITLPGKLELLDDKCAYLTIKEGKFHQVKHMIKALGGEVTKLHRIRIGEVYLDESLDVGTYRLLTREEIISLGG